MDIAYIRLLQEDMLLVRRPYGWLGVRIGRSEDDLFVRTTKAQERSYMRRVASVLCHRGTGFEANGMAVWTRA